MVCVVAVAVSMRVVNIPWVGDGRSAVFINLTVCKAVLGRTEMTCPAPKRRNQHSQPQLPTSFCIKAENLLDVG